MNSGINLVHGDISNLDDIKELWEELNQHHLDKSRDFKQFYREFTFSSRKETLINRAENGKLLVLIAWQNYSKVGYCVASVVDDVGEIDSIFVKSDYRNSRIGNTLMEESLNWIKSWKAKKVIVKVSAGNEEVFRFYSKYGFAPRLTELQLIP